MSDASSEIIYHNYPQSPVAEKVRAVFGFKQLAWRDVEIPRLTPKPKLTELTGGYRRTPVMQIGADIFCDSQCIIRELERRHPSPALLPEKDRGVLWILSRWVDGPMFDLGVKMVLGAAGDDLPADFAQDRGRLYLGPDWAEGLKKANADLPHLVSQMRAPFSWLDDRLGNGDDFLFGNAPTSFDAQIYHVVWFVRGRWSGGAELLSAFPNLVAWETRVREIGHGTQTSMDPDDAIARAASCEPAGATGVAAGEPQGLEVGMSVEVNPDVDGGEQPTKGTLRYADAETVSVDRVSDAAGNLCVHFPRAGYRVDIVS